ncbi:hypothetical protein AVEN_29440-1 [Araneus ventricosus]|uniref:Uncharacterized protein n=1 Tax=Araneus ventricosus TaxID=182803 RepID=A0A4Y2CYN8_ARAVE|nr:hypothetical protein AVEN_29440-1 [Araneus ventricosus]
MTSTTPELTSLFQTSAPHQRWDMTKIVPDQIQGGYLVESSFESGTLHFRSRDLITMARDGFCTFQWLVFSDKVYNSNTIMKFCRATYVTRRACRANMV